jgi:hypothetical protein
MRDCELPFFFVTGDEKMYDEITKEAVKEVFGINEIAEEISSQSVWEELRSKFNVFYLHKPYFKKSVDN